MGSTVVLLFGPAVAQLAGIPSGKTMRMGEAMGRLGTGGIAPLP
jgi:hypothetical protein